MDYNIICLGIALVCQKIILYIKMINIQNKQVPLKNCSQVFFLIFLLTVKQQHDKSINLKCLQDGKIVKNSGFHGRGFKFDETEAQLADERRKLQKRALGLQDSDDEDAGVDVSYKITK